MEKAERLSTEELEMLNGIWFHVQVRFGEEPEKESAHKQKRICQWIRRTYGETIGQMPEKVSEYFLPEKNSEDTLHYLKECSLQAENLEQEYSRQIESLTSAFTPETAEALQEIVLSPFWQRVSRKGDKVEFIVGEEAAILRRLTLYGAEGMIPDSNQVLYGSVELSKENGRFWLRGEAQNAESEIAKVELSFLRADVQVESCRIAAEWGCFETPWSCLQGLGALLMEKDRIAGYACNQEEKALLPLIREVVSLDPLLEGNDRVETFPKLKEIAREHGNKNVVELLDKMEKTLPDNPSYQKLLDELLFILNEIECEPLWRGIFNRIERSQNTYPDKVDVLCPPELLQKCREDVQRQMETLGYTGKYPDFYREGWIRGSRLKRSGRKIPQIGPKKRTAFLIHCQENVDRGELSIQFLCGTAMLEKEETKPDIWGCIFHHHGKRLFYQLYWTSSMEELQNWEGPGECAQAAVKQVELQRLSRKEKSRYTFYAGWRAGDVLLYGILIGLLFSVVLNAGLMLLGTVIILLAGQGANFGNIFWGIPWWFLFLLAWFGFGIAMAVYTWISQNRHS